jgi:hypothetical protein
MDMDPTTGKEVTLTANVNDNVNANDSADAGDDDSKTASQNTSKNAANAATTSEHVDAAISSVAHYISQVQNFEANPKFLSAILPDLWAFSLSPWLNTLLLRALTPGKIVY